MDRLLLEKVRAGSLNAKRQNNTKNNLSGFGPYFAEQSVALLGTGAQQAAFSWLAHKVVPLSLVIGYDNFPLGAPLGSLVGFICSGLTWLLLTVWTFKIRGHLSGFVRRAKILFLSFSKYRSLTALSLRVQDKSSLDKLF
jgi:hypothetical protein